MALALVSLFGLSLVLTHHGQRRAVAGVAWLLGLTFTIVAALGSQHGGRELAGRTDSAIAGERARLEAAYKRESEELAALPPARPASVADAELAVILKDVRLKDCRGWLENRRFRTICVEKVEPARAEQSIARERERLQTAMTDATAALSKLTVGKPANTDANAIERYLAAVGIRVGTQRLADLLNLLTVHELAAAGAVNVSTSKSGTVVELVTA